MEPKWSHLLSNYSLCKYLQIHLSTSLKSLYVFKRISLNNRKSFTLFVDFWVNVLRFVSDVFWIYHLNFFFDYHLVRNYSPVRCVYHLDSVFVPQFRRILSMCWRLTHSSLWFAWRLWFCAQGPLFLPCAYERYVCLNFLPPLLASALSLSKQWALVLGHPGLSGALDWIRFLWVTAP